ncbi:zinc ion binding protein, partial [Trifolium pratense]
PPSLSLAEGAAAAPPSLLCDHNCFTPGGAESHQNLLLSQSFLFNFGKFHLAFIHNGEMGCYPISSDTVALIPFARVDDFVRGQSNNKECPTRFYVRTRRRHRPPSTPLKQKVDGTLDYILYWCSFGPDDPRKGGVVPPKKKNAGRPNTKRGCTCHFIVKRLIAEPSVALITYNNDKHVDEKGLPCHGPQDNKAAGTPAEFAPYISEDLRLRVLSLL